jgi:hypothetical protein
VAWPTDAHYSRLLAVIRAAAFGVVLFSIADPYEIATSLGSGSCPSRANPCQPVSRMGACCDDMRRKFHHRGAV